MSTSEDGVDGERWQPGNGDRGTRAFDDASLADLDADELPALVAELRAENRRLREEYARARRTEYRNSAMALFALGLLAVAGALALPVGREVLFILGSIGLFGGTMTWFLTPERLVTTTVGRSIYESAAETGNRLRDELGLQETAVYVPVNRRPVNGVPVRLFVPQSPEYELPSVEALTSLFVLPDATAKRGVAVRPTASRLIGEVEKSTGGIASDPSELTVQLADALVEQFELVDGAEPAVDAESGRITVRVHGSVYDGLTGFDHPVPSVLGTGCAVGLDQPITVEVTESEDDTLVTCRW
ncbi:hypothetical protein ACFR97_01125 [Haloplanus litoreus]|uniref:DUF7982 domain-containing protein n=1 Tax=Haloplanus litoreus TaxID=767515 RepID=A0ABD5ZWL3_9EURY